MPPAPAFHPGPRVDAGIRPGQDQGRNVGLLLGAVHGAEQLLPAGPGLVGTLDQPLEPMRLASRQRGAERDKMLNPSRHDRTSPTSTAGTRAGQKYLATRAPTAIGMPPGTSTTSTPTAT